MTYPHDVGFQKTSETSFQAARKCGKTAAVIETAVIQHLMLCRHYGSTVGEAREKIQEWSRKSYDRSTIGARFTELKHRGEIVMTEQTRKDPVSGMNVSVFIHKSFIQAQMSLDLSNPIGDNQAT